MWDFWTFKINHKTSINNCLKQMSLMSVISFPVIFILKVILITHQVLRCVTSFYLELHLFSVAVNLTSIFKSILQESTSLKCCLNDMVLCRSCLPCWHRNHWYAEWSGPCRATSGCLLRCRGCGRRTRQARSASMWCQLNRLHCLYSQSSPAMVPQSKSLWKDGNGNSVLIMEYVMVLGDLSSSQIGVISWGSNVWKDLTTKSIPASVHSLYPKQKNFEVSNLQSSI